MMVLADGAGLFLNLGMTPSILSRNGMRFRKSCDGYRVKKTSYDGARLFGRCRAGGYECNNDTSNQHMVS
jgi:hypothetical protein